MANFLQIQTLVPTLFILVIGFALWWRGYSIFRGFLMLTGLFGGYWSGNLLHQQFHFSTTYYWTIIVLLGLGLASFTWLAYRTSFLLAGASFAGYLSYRFQFQWLDYNANWSILLSAAIGAILAMVFYKAFIVIGSSLLGSLFILMAGQAFVQGQNMMLISLSQVTNAFSFILFNAVFPLILTVLGSYLQFKNMKKSHFMIKQG